VRSVARAAAYLRRTHPHGRRGRPARGLRTATEEHRDVELRTLTSGAAVARLRVATTTPPARRLGMGRTTNDFTVEVFGTQARNCAQYLSR
jgi:Single-strand binding protein family